MKKDLEIVIIVCISFITIFYCYGKIKEMQVNISKKESLKLEIQHLKLQNKLDSLNLIKNNQNNYGK